ncbi:MAG: NAD(P)H-binding protein [Bacteroidia bacterium]|nr:NAD(P)H-binding protein [Bacteroidia bacterium]
MKKILITGGTGVLGKSLVGVLENNHSPYIIGSRNQPSADTLKNHWKKLNLATGEGLDESLEGVGTIFHLASATRPFSADTDVVGTQKMLEAGKKAGVNHVIYVSIVGIDKVPISYYKIKLAAEHVIKNAGLDYTILRATQFHEFLDNVIRKTLKYPIAFMPKAIQYQPISLTAVVDKLLDIYERGPINDTLEIGGPEVMTMGKVAQIWLRAHNRKKWIINVPVTLAGRLGKNLAEGGLTTQEATISSQTWKEYLEQPKTV